MHDLKCSVPLKEESGSIPIPFPIISHVFFVSNVFSNHGDQTNVQNPSG